LVLATFLGAVAGSSHHLAHDRYAEEANTEGLDHVRAGRRGDRRIVLEYGLVVGFVVFGLGGLMRSRRTSSTRDTGR
jgi:hypothetical protein